MDSKTTWRRRNKVAELINDSTEITEDGISIGVILVDKASTIADRIIDLIEDADPTIGKLAASELELAAVKSERDFMTKALAALVYNSRSGQAVIARAHLAIKSLRIETRWDDEKNLIVEASIGGDQ